MHRCETFKLFISILLACTISISLSSCNQNNLNQEKSQKQESKSINRNSESGDDWSGGGDGKPDGECKTVDDSSDFCKTIIKYETANLLNDVEKETISELIEMISSETPEYFIQKYSLEIKTIASNIQDTDELESEEGRQYLEDICEQIDFQNEHTSKLNELVSKVSKFSSNLKGMKSTQDKLKSFSDISNYLFQNNQKCMELCRNEAESYKSRIEKVIKLQKPLFGYDSRQITIQKKTLLFSEVM